MTKLTNDTERLLATAAAWRGQPTAIATVISTWGSAPRPQGSQMLVHADGRFEGSVSGGCVEGDVLHAAAETIADGAFRRLHFSVGDDQAWEVSLPCGGEIEVIVQPVADGGYSAELFDAIATSRNAGRTLAVTTDLATSISYVGDAPGAGRFVNRHAPPRRLLIVGAVQIAQSLAAFGGALDTTTTIIDPRDRFRTEARFPGVVLDGRWPDEAIAALAPDASTAVVTLSHDPKIDDPALIAALASPAGYIAALGSRRSQAKRMERLAAAGMSDAALARIDAPAGLPIGALGPAEIALSVAAGMVKALRGA
jgi:xanthine dehydrogenase accessory factor